MKSSCKKFLFLGVFFLAVSLVLLFFSYSKLSNQLGISCKPYNLKVKSGNKKVIVSWITIKPCTGYVKYFFVNNIKESMPTNKLLKAMPYKNKASILHKVEILNPTTSYLYFFIVSDGIYYGGENNSGIVVRLNE